MIFGVILKTANSSISHRSFLFGTDAQMKGRLVKLNKANNNKFCKDVNLAAFVCGKETFCGL